MEQILGIKINFHKYRIYIYIETFYMHYIQHDINDLYLNIKFAKSCHLIII